MRRTKADSLQTRADLIDSALEVFDKQGVSKTTLAQIASHAGVTRGAVYWHFKNKEDLFAAMCDTIFAEFERYMGERMQPTQWDDFLQNILYSFEYITKNKRIQKLIRVISRKWETTPENDGIYKIWEKHASIGEERLTLLLKTAQQNGKLADGVSVIEAVSTLRAAHWGLIISWITRQDFDLIRIGKITFSGCLKELSKAK